MTVKVPEFATPVYCHHPSSSGKPAIRSPACWRSDTSLESPTLKILIQSFRAWPRGALQLTVNGSPGAADNGFTLIHVAMPSGEGDTPGMGGETGCEWLSHNTHPSPNPAATQVAPAVRPHACVSECSAYIPGCRVKRPEASLPFITIFSTAASSDAGACGTPKLRIPSPMATGMSAPNPCSESIR